MGRSYPRIGEQRKHKPKTSLVCEFKPCDNQATRRQFIQVTWFRGDDESVNLCKVHYKNATEVYESKP